MKRGLIWKAPAVLTALTVGVLSGVFNPARAQSITDLNVSDSDAAAVSEGSESTSGVLFAPEYGDSTVEAPSPFSFGLGIQLRADTPDPATAPGHATLALPGGGYLNIPMEQKVRNFLGIAASADVYVSDLTPEQQIVFWTAMRDAGLQNNLLLGTGARDANRLGFAQMMCLLLEETDRLSSDMSARFSNIIQVNGHALMWRGEPVELNDEVRLQIASQIIDYTMNL